MSVGAGKGLGDGREVESDRGRWICLAELDWLSGISDGE